MKKAALFNLIIFTQERDYEPLEIMISKRFPCRVISIKSHHEEVPLTTTYKERSVGVGDIFYDRHTIDAGGRSLHRVPYEVLPLLAADLPVVLFWGADPTEENIILPHLLQYAERLIFDSECTHNLRHFSHHILKKLKGFTCDVIDMNWARFAGWRTLMSQVCDTPERLVSGEITIYHNNSSCSQADYFQAWLSTRLGWKFNEVKDGSIIYDNATVHLKEKNAPDLPEGCILGFENDKLSVSVDLESPKQARVEWRGNQPFNIPIKRRAAGSTFVQELLYSQPSRHYRTMLHVIGQEND